MTSTMEAAIGAQATTIEGSRNQPPAERRRGGARRGDRRDRGANDQTSEGPRGGRRGGNRGRGGNRAGANAPRSGRALDDGREEANSGAGSTARAAFGSGLTKIVNGDQRGESGTDADAAEASKPAVEDGDEGEVCFICASPVIHNAVAPCNHHTCHICALRMRALYKTKACAHCRTNSDFIVFTDDSGKKFEDFGDADFARSDDHLGIKYEKTEIFEDTILLLRYNCPDSSCDIACLSWPDLHRHVRSVHHKVMCDLCTRNKKVFTHEHELFTPQDLRKHEKFGDDNPGAVDQSGFRGHPECGFCRQRFYGDDELYTHCRDKHERCHICDRRNEGRQQQYYMDYNSLEVHFRKDHFLCPDNECLEKKFVVFDSEIDLKAHQLENHPDGLSKDARRDARRIDISGFDYRNQHQPERGGRREGRGRGRGRDPNTEPLPSSTAQPMRRDELAYQRQMAVQSAQSVSTRTFGGQLTSGDAYAARPPPRAERQPTETTTVTAPPPSRADEDLPSVESLSVSDSAASPQQQARAIHHSAVLSRASTLLQNSSEKLATFRSLVSSYRSSSTSASSLTESLLNLFRTTTSSNADIGKLIRELAEIYENEAKRNDLLKAWNDWRAVNEDYPALPPGAASSGGGLLGGGGARVLKLKRATAPSSRSSMGRHESWGSAAGLEDPFPAVAASNNRNNNTSTSTSTSNNKGPKPTSSSAVSTPWSSFPTSSSSAPSSRPSSRPPHPAPSSSSYATAQRSSTPTARSTAKTGSGRGADAFPALPTTAKPTSTIFGYGTGAVRRNGAGASGDVASPWGGGGGFPAAGPAVGDEGVGEPNQGTAGTGKKKGGKKQMLFHFG